MTDQNEISEEPLASNFPFNSFIYPFRTARRSKRRKAPSRYFQNYENTLKVRINFWVFQVSQDRKATRLKEG